MPIQILTGQWSKIFTEKVRVQAADLVSMNNRRKNLELFTVNRATQVVGVKMWLRESFVKAGMTSLDLYIINDNFVGMNNVNANNYFQMDGLITPSDDSGRVDFKEGPIGNQLAPNTIYLRSLTNNTGDNSPFTAGEVDIWVMTMKLP